MNTVAAAFADAAARWPDHPFLHVPDEADLTYAEALAQVEALRADYADLAPGPRVGLMLGNRPEMFLHWFALNGLGISVVPLNADLRPAELDYIVQHSEISLAVTQGRNIPSVPNLPLPLPHSAPGRAGISAAPTSQIECALLYTSGTTARPKGCVLSNAYFLRCGQWYATVGDLCALRRGVERLITPLPMTHMNAMACSTMAMITVGGCIIPIDRFHPSTWWRSVRDSRATIVHYLGVMPSMLLGAPPDPLDRAHGVRFGFGAGVDRRHHAVFEERFGFPLLEAWAMTETGNGAVVIANIEPRHVGTSCFGRPQPDVEIRIVDDQGQAAQQGELLVRAAGLDPRAGFFTEYLKDPGATAEAWDGGWFHTGDVVRRGDDGSLYFIDRQKNVIRRSGENIAAAEVESILRRHEAVKEVAVAAVPDDIRGEEVLACIVPHASDTPPESLARAIVDSALQDLSYYKVPGYIAFVDSLPLTATQKIQRGELKALAATLPGTAACIDTRALKRRA